jgi:8-oxo-dGTP diphosphatase
LALFLVRHAKAGSRREWEGDDDLRPLSKKGRRQAEHLAADLADRLADDLADRGVARILSSPSVRCVQTVEPLAARLGLKVETADALGEGSDAPEVVALVRELAPERSAAVVLCTHGDVIPTLLDALARLDGLRLPADYPCAKGSTWRLEPDEEGRFKTAEYLPAP